MKVQIVNFNNGASDSDYMLITHRQSTKTAVLIHGMPVSGKDIRI